MFASFVFGADLSQGEYIVQDIFTYFVSTMCIMYTRPSNILRGNPPTGKIFGPKTIASILGPLVITWAAVGIMLNLLLKEPWFVPHTIGTKAVYYLPETTSLWLLSLFILPGCYIGMTFGSTWRQPIYKNIPIIIVFVISLTITVLFVGQFLDLAPLYNLMEIVDLQNRFFSKIAVIGALSFAAVVIWEAFFVIGPVGKFLHHMTQRGRVKSDGKVQSWYQTTFKFFLQLGNSQARDEADFDDDDDNDYVLWLKHKNTFATL